MKTKAAHAILATLIIFAAFIGVSCTPVSTESIPITEVFYGDAQQVFSQGVYVIATETNPVEIYSNYATPKLFYEMLKEHVATEASTKQFISILLSQGVCPSSVYSVGIETITKLDHAFEIGANFTQPSRNCIVLWIITNPTALIPIGNLSAGEYSITLQIDRYEYSCSARAYFYIATETWTKSFKVLRSADVNGDGVVDIFDICVISAHWYPGPPIGLLGYDPSADINNDGATDILDIGIVSAHWGETE